MEQKLEDIVFTDLILDNYIHGIIYFDENKTVKYLNKTFEVVTGVNKEDLIDKYCDNDMFCCLNEEDEKFCPIQDSFDNKKIVRKECFIENSFGYRIPVIITASPVYRENNFHGIFCSIEDNTLKYLHENRLKRLEHLVMIDELTGLPNRRFFNANLNKCFAKLKRFDDYSFGIIFLDIDNFKKINDTYGHDIGDEVLKNLASLLKELLRKYDVSCRFGGEEFVILLQYIDETNLATISERVRKHIEKNLKISKNNKPVTVSIGATLALRSDNYDSLIKRADDLMYQSKIRGKNRVTVG